MSELVDKALRAKRESKYVDFERSFDPDSAGEWCELIKDIVAIANTGGGVLLVGVENDGNPSGENVQAVLDLDHATVSKAVFKEQFSNIKHYPVSDEAPSLRNIGSGLPFECKKIDLAAALNRKKTEKAKTVKIA